MVADFLASSVSCFIRWRMREHTYIPFACSINERWDCGIVNHSPYACSWNPCGDRHCGYLLLGVLAFMNWTGMLVAGWVVWALRFILPH